MRIAILLVAGMLMACGGAGGDAAPEADKVAETPATGVVAEPTEVPDCVYELHNDLTGETTELTAIPDTFYVSSHGETADGGVVATISDTKDADLDATLVVPPCLRDEALALIEAIQDSDKAQAQEGVDFEDRRYP